MNTVTAAVEPWIEETLRYDTSSQMLARYVVEDREVAGVTIHGAVMNAVTAVSGGSRYGYAYHYQYAYRAEARDD